MKKYLVIILLIFFNCCNLLAQNKEGLSIDIKIDKVIKANLNINNFIYLWSDDSDFSMTIGIYNDRSNFFTNKDSLDEIRKLISIINLKAKLMMKLKQVTVTDEYFIFEYDDMIISFKKKENLQVKIY